MAPITALIVRFLDKRIAGFHCRLKPCKIAADRRGLSTGRGKAKSQREGDSQK